MNDGGAPAPEGQAGPTLHLRSRIPQSAHGALLLDHLVRRFPYLDRAGWVAEIAAGRLHLDGRRALAADTVRGGASLVYHKPHREPPVDRNVALLHSDPHVVVVDKPAHLPVHGDGPFVQNTLVHIARTLFAPELRLVHRLDRETSGVCVLARTEQARAALAGQFEAGTVQKTYLAIVRGRPAERSFAIDLPIGHRADGDVAIRRSAAPDAVRPKPARTHVTLLTTDGDRSLLRCVPATGRTHQVRVHLEAAGVPVLGDKLYGRPDADYLAFVHRVKAGALPGDVPAGEPGRHLLHASELTFVHPGTGTATTFRAPLPADFEPWLAGAVRAADG